MTTLEDLLSIEAELKRFAVKLESAIEIQKEHKRRGDHTYWGVKMSAARRSALDLKVELTKLTKG